MIKTPQKYTKFLTILLLLVLGGCSATGKYTVPASNTNFVTKQDKAAIIFMRASNYGGAITSPLVSLDKDGNSEMVAILGPGEKMVHYVEPGEHTFMIVGENGDFLKANVDAGKAYYAIIRPRMGIWKARFSLTPFKALPESEEFSINSENLKEWSSSCKYTEASPAAFAWHKTKQNELKAIYNEYMPKWQAKSGNQRAAATLTAKDAFDNISF